MRILTKVMLNITTAKLQYFLVVVEKILVDAFASKKPDIGVIRDCAIG